jgi:hypothetical protein
MIISDVLSKALQNGTRIMPAISGTAKGLFFRQSSAFSMQHMQLQQSPLALTLGNSYRNFSSGEKNMQPPVGLSNFRQLIEHKDPKGKSYLFVDKSLFIKELLDDSSDVVLITRPRRFGKTLNLSMLHHFFSKEVNDKPTGSLFFELKISEDAKYMGYQGKFPVIFLTFKDIKSSSFKAAYDDFCGLISKAYEVHEKQVLSSEELTERQKKRYELILDRRAEGTDIRASLQDLTFYLSKCYGVKPIVLIDEYDTPIQTAYVEKYYKEMITFMREFFGAGLKDNSYMEKAILTGILRVAKESLFSGLNNISTYSLLTSQYGSHFGFTEEEISELLEKSNLVNKTNEVKDWYNGYQAGDVVIYNPWSIVNYIKKQELNSYWINTSDNALIKELLIKSSTNFKAQFEILLKGQSVEKIIDENTVFDQLEMNESGIWNLLLMSGYLKIVSSKKVANFHACMLAIPNNEVKGLYQKFIAEWLSGVDDAMVFTQFLNNLLEGKVADFEERLKEIMLQTFSVHDIKGKNPEKFFHGFMLGLTAFINPKHYTIDSNRESGLGRYDIVISPYSHDKLGIILEIKSVEKDASIQSLRTESKNALDQIEAKQYEKSSLLKNVKACLKIGIAFSGKELAITHKISDFRPRFNIENGNKPD